MTVVWGIHNNQPDLDLIGGGFVTIGWDELGDMSALPDDRDFLKDRLAETYPDVTLGAIRVWAGVILRFNFEMQPGDYIICPNKADSTINIGRVIGDFYVEPGVDVHRNRRHVEWLRTGVPRTEFSQGARYEIGSAVTLFKVKNHTGEFLAAVGVAPPGDDTPVAPVVPPVPGPDLIENEPSAERVAAYSRDFVVDVLRKMDPFRFEHFTAAVLRAMGYHARPTVATGDGGVDVIASKDALGIEHPVIKVQCKRTVNTIGAPDVQNLAGALAHGGSEVGLFVTLGSYSADARHLERTRQDLRLVNGTELIDMIFEHYERLDPEWQALLPLRQVYAVDRDAELS
ncbi:restriction endonuclease [Aquihabitans sp. McL0605]|uniref:restriction endonuclease n=1 Tax=Aquihabitans sp. McL0605 TaxID=3415671 RepID=UPI003CF62017